MLKLYADSIIENTKDDDQCIIHFNYETRPGDLIVNNNRILFTEQSEKFHEKESSILLNLLKNDKHTYNLIFYCKSQEKQVVLRVIKSLKIRIDM